MSNVDTSSQISSNSGAIDRKSVSNKINVAGTWGLPLCDVYKLALSFYKEKEGKAVQLSYEDKLQLVAFAQQVSHGPLVNSNVPPVGALDVVGRDRRLAWQKLADLSTDQARTGFVSLLSRRCPLFETYLEAHRRDNEEQQKKAQENAIRELEKRKQQEIDEKMEKEKEVQHIQEEIARRKVKQALNEQTYDQFCIYAEQQYPGDPERQGDLVKQLQEQHYLQYMQQLQATIVTPRINDNQAQSAAEVTTDEETLEENIGTSLLENNRIAEASMWTSPNVQEFKDTVSKGDGDGFLRVGHGERVIVRVPTRNDTKRLFWEFATDHYDIGFGVFFEWGTPNTDQVLVHVSGSEDEDEEDDEEDYDEIDFYESNNDLETGTTSHAMSQRQRNNNLNQQPILTEIVPVYRRDSHIEVYAGTHVIPAQGCYLLRFDNSYSLWRSKTLYYRVYYTNEE